jgi:AcrR family transcriptional regulator
MTQQTRKKAGRPRTLDLETLLDTAAGMDLSTISMKDLAERLGVGVATVYRYVSDRNALVRLASARAAHRNVPAEAGQPWQEVVAGYAASIYSALSTTPALLHAYIDGNLGAELEVEFADRFLEAMIHRGFSAEEAMEIFRAMGFIALGAAAASAHIRADRKLQGPVEARVVAALDSRNPGELAALRAALTHYVGVVGEADLPRAIETLVSGITARKTALKQGS